MTDRHGLVWHGATIALLALSLIAGCGSDKTNASPQKGAGSPAQQTLTITVAPVEARTVQRTVETTGSLLAWEEVVLNTAVAGTAARLLVDLGDRVQLGQVVAELDKREFALAV